MPLASSNAQNVPLDAPVTVFTKTWTCSTVSEAVRPGAYQTVMQQAGCTDIPHLLNAFTSNDKELTPEQARALLFFVWLWKTPPNKRVEISQEVKLVGKNSQENPLDTIHAKIHDHALYLLSWQADVSWNDFRDIFRHIWRDTLEEKISIPGAPAPIEDSTDAPAPCDYIVTIDHNGNPLFLVGPERIRGVSVELLPNTTLLKVEQAIGTYNRPGDQSRAYMIVDTNWKVITTNQQGKPRLYHHIKQDKTTQCIMCWSTEPHPYKESRYQTYEACLFGKDGEIIATGRDITDSSPVAGINGESIQAFRLSLQDGRHALIDVNGKEITPPSKRNMYCQEGWNWYQFIPGAAFLERNFWEWLIVWWPLHLLGPLVRRKIKIG